MKQTILGLNIGTASITGIRLAKRFRNLRLLNAFEIPVKREDEENMSESLLTQGQVAALETLLSEGTIQRSDLIALAIPGDLVSNREITLPFTDLKKINQIAAFEVESELPFDLEEVSLDYMVLNRPKKSSPQNPDGGDHSQETHLLVSALPKKTLQGLLDTLQTLEIDPAWIGTSALSLFSYAKYFLGMKIDTTAETLVIHVTPKRTHLCHILGSHLNWIRTIPIGENAITEALSKTLQISWSEAEIIKSEIDLNMDDPTDEKTIVTLETIEESISGLVTEIEKSIRFLSPANEQESSGFTGTEAIENIEVRRLFHLCGTGSLLNGFESHLSSVLEMEPIRIDLEKGSPANNISGIEDIEPEAISPFYALPFGLALQDSDGPPINFRHGEFAYGKETLARRNRFVSISLILILLLGLMGGDLYLHHQKKEQQYQSIKNELRSAFLNIFPNTRNIVNEVEQTRAAINQQHQVGDFFGIKENSPLTILKEITLSIPDKVKIDVFNLVIDGGTVRIQAQTDSFESVDRIRGGLLASKQFQQIEVSDAKSGARKKHVRFRIKMNILQKEISGKNRTS